MGTAAVGLVLMGCSGDDDVDDVVAPTSAPATTVAATATAEPEVASTGYPLTFPEPPGTPKAGGTLEAAGSWDISLFDPTRSIAAGTLAAVGMVYNRLLSFPTGVDADPFKVELGPELAENWEQPEATRYIFHLAPGINWHDVPPLNGRKFTAEDVKYAYDRYATEGVSTGYFEFANQIDVIDDDTLAITLREPLADFIVSLNTRYLPIFPRELVEQGLIETEMVGTGPVILKQAAKSEHLLFDKNPDYFQGEPLIDGLKWRIMPDAPSRTAAFRAGQIATHSAGTERDLLALLDTNPDTQLHTNNVDSVAFALSFNLDDPKFADDRVRQAISLSLDRETIGNVLYGPGFFVSLPSIPYSFRFDHLPSADELGPWWHHDPAEARKMLDAAGVSDLEFSIIYYEYSPTSNTGTLELAADQFRETGITLKLQRAEYTQFNSQWSEHNFTEAAHGWRPAFTEADAFFYNHLHSESPGNRWRIRDAQLDEWATAQRVELDTEKRQAIHNQMWDRMQDKMYRVETPAGIGFTLYQPWVRGLRFGGARGTNTSLYEWGHQLHRVWLDA